MKKKLLALYSLKFNPFSADIPTAALFPSPAIESFCWRIENQVGEGGFALVSGEPGSGKSAALRITADRLGAMQDVMIGLLSRPQASVLDFYRELAISSAWHYPPTTAGMGPKRFGKNGRLRSRRLSIGRC